MPASRLIGMLALNDVAYGECGSDDAGAGQGRLENRCGDHAGDAELIHDVGQDAARVLERLKAVGESCWRSRDLQHANTFARDFSGQLSFGHDRLLWLLRAILQPNPAPSHSWTSAPVRHLRRSSNMQMPSPPACAAEELARSRCASPFLLIVA